jgi:hypothetical protein
MKLEGLHEGKSGICNLSANTRKKSSRETAKVDRLLLKTMSVAEGALIYCTAYCTQTLGANPPLLPTR